MRVKTNPESDAVYLTGERRGSLNLQICTRARSANNPVDALQIISARALHLNSYRTQSNADIFRLYNVSFSVLHLMFAGKSSYRTLSNFTTNNFEHAPAILILINLYELLNLARLFCKMFAQIYKNDIYMLRQS